MNHAIKYSFLFVLLLTIFSRGFAQLSPGDLSEAHAHLEGLSNCTKCHILGEKETTSKCLDCHKEINSLIDQNKGYHATVVINGKDCHDCHGEHFGREFQIVRFDKDTFNHRLARFELEGKHAEIRCEECHKTDLVQNNISQKKGNTWLGLGTACIDCHSDFHQNTLSNNCLSCHNQQVFRPAPGFDHAETDFQLVGKHAEIDCNKCHKTEQRNGQEYQKFAGVEFAKCTACHEDVHQNKFGNDCRKCHNEFSFREVTQLNTFNHEQTNYPLRGKHEDLDCKKCHTSGSYTRKLKYQFCTDCHTDYHAGQFAENGVAADCAECHSVEGFSPSSYGIEQHNKSNFRLDGSHLATPCFSCHKKTEKWNFAGIGNGCIDCHENIHQSYFDEKYLAGGGCINCHSTLVWNEIEFNHNITEFRLEGKHAGLSCKECHFAKSNNGELNQQFAWKNQSCTNCHNDVHYGQFTKNEVANCERCHAFNNWNPEKFDHDDSRFKLDGKHVGLDCEKCHMPNDELTKDYIVYKFEDVSCKSCH